jgi:cyclopropane fatty-acyl-phospholipid synthase-like methyltransferase
VIEAIWERGQAEAEAIAAMLEKNGVASGSWLLELGAGNARVAIPLARRGYKVTGVEYSHLFVEDGLRRIREAGLNPALFEMANIRDQCSWVHSDNPEKLRMQELVE